MCWEVGERFKKEGERLYLWLMHVDVWQKPTQYCQAISLKLKIDNFFLKDRAKCCICDCTSLYFIIKFN